MTAALLVAQISDVHLGPIVGFDPRYWNLKRATGYINWTRNRRLAYSRPLADRLIADARHHGAAHLMITGDLVNIGLPAELAAAARWLEQVGRTDEVSVIPGNHDIYSGIGRDEGVARWARYMTSDAAGLAFGAPRTGFPFVRCIGDVAIIGVNSAIETAPFVASGQVGAEQLTRLDALLDKIGRQKLFRLVMIHHPPLPGQAKAARDLRDAAALERVLAARGAELVVHGHNHRNMLAHVAHVGGACPVVGAPSGSLAMPHGREPLARYNLYRIERQTAGFAIEMTGRGLATPDGPIVELERRWLSRNQTIEQGSITQS